MHRFSGTAIADTLTEVFDSQNATMGWKGGMMGSAHLHALFQDSNMTLNSVDERTKGLATSMTTIVRTSGGDRTTTYTPENAKGVVWVNTTCVCIR
jgi:hypothetical protein